MSIFATSNNRWRIIDKTSTPKVYRFRYFKELKQHLINMQREFSIKKYPYSVNYKNIEVSAEIISSQSDREMDTHKYMVDVRVYSGDSSVKMPTYIVMQSGGKRLRYFRKTHVDAIMRDMEYVISKTRTSQDSNNEAFNIKDVHNLGMFDNGEDKDFLNSCISLRDKMLEIVGDDSTPIKITNRINPTNTLIFETVCVSIKGTDWNHTKNVGSYADINSAKLALSKSFMKNTHSINKWYRNHLSRFVDIDMGYRIKI